MTRVFLDTNVLLDFVTQRDGFENACDILQLGEDGKVNLFTSFLTMANTAYVARRCRTSEELYCILKGLAEMVDVLPMDKKQLSDALAIKALDIEDVMQYTCAKAGKCDIIVTRNLRHFPFSKDITVSSPTDFIKLFAPET